MKFSVLMAVYINDRPEFVNEAMQSILNQSLKPNQVVLVKDGPIGDNLDKVIYSFAEKFDDFEIITLSKNGGLAIALNKGLEACKYKWVARMDSDDISHPERFERQIDYLERHKDVVLLGTWYKEFLVGIDNLVSSKTFPSTHKEIEKYSKRRSPFHHSSVIYNKDIVCGLGGYDTELTQVQDYLLWCKIIKSGCKTANLNDYLLFVRADDNFYNRRTGMKYLRREYLALRKIYKIGYYSKYEFLKNISIRGVARLVPVTFLKIIYKSFLRS